MTKPTSYQPDSPSWTPALGMARYKVMLESQESRWTMGRADAFGRMLLGIIFTIAQTAKLVVKSALFWTVLGPAMGDPTALKGNYLQLTKTATNTGRAFAEIFAAPNKGYESCYKQTVNNLSKLLLGKDLEVEAVLETHIGVSSGFKDMMRRKYVEQAPLVRKSKYSD